MLSSLMRSTSVLAVSLALAAPHPVIAQSTETCADGSAPVMAEGSETPVCPEDGAAAAQPTEEAPEVAEDAPEAAEEAPAAEPAPEAAAEAEEPAQTEPPAQESSEAEAVEEAATESEPAQEVAEETPSEPAEELVEEPAAEPETTAETTEEVTEQPASEPETAAETTEEVAEEPATEADASAETAAEAEAETQAESAEETPPAAQESDAPTEETADEAAEPAGDEPTETAEAPVEEQGSAEAEAQSDAPSEAASDPSATADSTAGEDETTAPDQTAEQGTEPSEDEAADTPAEVEQEDTAESAAEANEPVAAEAAQAMTDEAADPGNEVVETVTEETTRTSGEEFETAVQPARESDSGLSRLETFALGALGGAAIATLLNRNNEEVVVSSQDRLVVQDQDGSYRVLKNDDALLRQPGVEVATREFSDGSTRSIVTRQDGTQVVTIRAADGQVLRRTRILADGREVVLFDDTREFEPVDVASIRDVRRPDTVSATDQAGLRAALAALENPTDRRFSLRQIRQIRAVRELVPEIDLDSVNFESGSAVIRAEEASDLREIGLVMAEAIDENPNEVFLIEGHTDATGGAGMNLALSDRRAESVALALSEYFDIPPENMVVQGYGEANLKVRTQEAERANRRVAVRKITPLLYARGN